MFFKLVFLGYSDQSHPKSTSEYCPDESKPLDVAHSRGAAKLDSSLPTPGDLAFAQKCADLHRFIRPLLELLNGLKTGRFDKGLTNFQQSIAMDRLQRIVGILQKPEMGEKYLQNLLQIEVMLKVWFPHVATQSAATTAQNNTPSLPSRWHQNQLHIPVKKRKLSWSDSDSGPISPQHKQHILGSWQAESSDTVSSSVPEVILKGEVGSGSRLTDSTGTLSKSSYLCSKKENVSWKQFSLSSPRHSPVTQDNSVSSSSTITAADSP
ncbi:hypothetical protein LDENG_00164760 [Lucifuga dentata]|nr:hypothetical protein LDENG_00164760 [Lucifuga dentata]